MTPEEKQTNVELAQQLLEEQNFVPGVIAGVVAAILGGGIYAVIAVATGYAVGLMAIGIGAFVGFAVQFLGRGVESRFVVIAAVLSIVGCILGNIFSVILLFARGSGESPLDIFSDMGLGDLINIALESFQPIDLLYWALAAYAAYWFAKRRLTKEEELAIYTYENHASSNIP